MQRLSLFPIHHKEPLSRVGRNEEESGTPRAHCDVAICEKADKRRVQRDPGKCHRAEVSGEIASRTSSADNKGQRVQNEIKREVDDYYRDLSFLKKIFISRERIYHEVDDLVHSTLPRRVDEYLRGAAFAQEARAAGFNVTFQ